MSILLETSIDLIFECGQPCAVHAFFQAINLFLEKNVPAYYKKIFGKGIMYTAFV